MESPMIKQMMDKAVYAWDIDPIDRSWFISPDGELWSGMSHRLILKNKFKPEWDALRRRGAGDDEIEEIFTRRLILTGCVKIGELNNAFYAVVSNLNGRARDALKGFAKSLLKARDTAASSLTIQHIYRFGDETITENFPVTLHELAKGFIRSGV